jgi:N6-adenosine-specific RNA methylase IME4
MFLAPGHAPLKFHPLANLFPMLSEQELDDLGADIHANGQVETVKLHRGMVLDGRNRYTACSRKGLGVRTEIFNGSDREALTWVISKNLKRRHLTESQRAMVAAKLATLRLGDNQHSAQPAQICAPSFDLGDKLPAAAEPEAAISQTEAAETLNVSRRSVQSATSVLEKGTQELQEAVAQGAVAVSTAAEIAERPVEEQKAILDALPRDDTGKLTPEAKKEVRKVAREVRAEDQAAKKARRNEREAKLGARIKAMPEKKYGVIITDDEHRFIPYSEETGMDRAADNHYPTSDVATLAARDLDSIAADDCVLGSWVTDLARGIDVMRARGFDFKSYFVWVKDIVEIELTPEQRQTGLGGRVLMQIGNAGTGYWNRDRDELFLIGTRGKAVAPAMGEQGESVWFAARPALEPGEISKHSKKPPNAHEFFEKHYPNTPKIELNARRARPGWDVWGNEAPEPQQGLLGIETATASAEAAALKEAAE